MAGNAAYNNSPANPLFWGWYDQASLNNPGATQKYLVGLIHAILLDAQAQDLEVADLDIENEAMFHNTTVMFRLFYDNTWEGGTEVYTKLWEVMAARGFGAGRVTASTTLERPNSPTENCLSDYEVTPGGPRDSAFFLAQSSLVAGIDGRHFGMPKRQVDQNGLKCFIPYVCDDPLVPFETCRYGDMPGRCNDREDNSVYAKNVYDGVWKFITDRGKQNTHYVVFGETNTNQTGGCDDSTTKQARGNVDGFLASSLYANRLYAPYDNLTVMRPWANAQSGCYYVPHPLTPYVATGPPTAVKAAPYESTPTSGVWTFTFEDPDGYVDLKTGEVNFSLGLTRSDANACWVQYDRTANLLRLRRDDGTAWLPTAIPPGSGSLSNNQCTLSGGGSSVGYSGTTMTVSLNLTFSATFAGAKTIFMQTADNGAGNPTYAATTFWGPRGFAGGNPSLVFRASDSVGVWVSESRQSPSSLPMDYWYSAGGSPGAGKSPGADQNRAGDTFVAIVDNTATLRANLFRRGSRTWGNWVAAPGPALVGDPAVAVGWDGAAYTVARGEYGQYYLIR